MKLKQLITEATNDPLKQIMSDCNNFLYYYKKDHWPMMTTMMKRIDTDLLKNKKAINAIDKDIIKKWIGLLDGGKMGLYEVGKFCRWFKKNYKDKISEGTLNEGGYLSAKTVKGPASKVKKYVKDLIDTAKKDHGPDAHYTGDWDSVTGINIINKMFKTKDEAFGYIEDNANKWDNAIAVQFGKKGQWAIGALLSEGTLTEKVRPGEHMELNRADRKKMKTRGHMSDKEVKGTFTLVGRPQFGAVSVRSDVTRKLYKNLSGDMFNPAHIRNYLDTELAGTKFGKKELGRFDY